MRKAIRFFCGVVSVLCFPFVPLVFGYLYTHNEGFITQESLVFSGLATGALTLIGGVILIAWSFNDD